MTERGQPLGPSWEDFYRTEHSVLIGTRLKRFRENRGLTQGQALQLVKRPSGPPYSQPLLSRLEAGYANTPFYVYLQIAEGFGLEPGRLLGPEEAEKPVGDAELVLIEFLRRLGVSPAEAMARVVRGQRAA